MPECTKFFHLRYWCKQRMEQVAVNMGFKNAQIAKNKHQKCLKNSGSSWTAMKT